MATATTEYKLLDSKDGVIYDAETVYPSATTDSKEYPGNRRQVLEGAPPKETVLVRTAGNALMAVDKAMLEQKHVVSAVIPYGKGPGDAILVKCPYTDRLLSTRIPDGMGPGQVMLLQAPVDLGTTTNKLVDDNGDFVESTEYDDLKVAAEQELEKRHFGEEGDHSKEDDKDKPDEGFEMV
jgi:hypothetical protein